MPQPTAPTAPPPELAEAMQTQVDPPKAGNESGQPINDAFADLDKLVTPEVEKPVDDKVTKPDKPPAPDKDKKPTPPADKKAATTPDDKKTTPVEGDKTGKRSPWQIVHDKEAEIATLRKQLSERDAAKPNGEWQKERADLLKRIEERDNRLKERETALEFSAFEQSEKYKTDYEKPYTNAWNAGRNTVAKFKVTDSDGNERPGKPEDFDRLMQLEETDPDAAAAKLGEMFGNRASYVSAHMVKVKEQFQRIQDAREEFRTRGDEDRKVKGEQTEKETRELAEMFDLVRNGAAEKFPDLFATTDEDLKGKEMLGKGEHFANRVFSNGQPVADGDKPLTKSQKSALDAVAWQKLRSFDYQVSRRQKAEARNKELEAELAQYKQSEPTPGDGGKKAPEGELQSADALLEQYAM